MEIIIAATKTCNHRPLLEKIFQDAWLPYKVFYFESHPELMKKYKLKRSPLLIVDEKVEAIGMPEMDQIAELIERNKDISDIRTPKRAKNHMVPISINKNPGLVEVDTTWGSIQPMEAAKGVPTVGELEVFHHKKMNLSIIDARKSDTFEEVSIPGSKNIPYDKIVERMGELDKNHPSIFFCNGPQCPQSSTAIKKLIDAGYPANKILYYRGGMHDWITLGLPVQRA
ncbi:rhodanese-related sulfurtransferase [Gillisia sp. Hel_I_86]|uniref:rhodanese-like domain-containing protein n=1 Tax=Gillisia sp. Hel_I_86 TaxID=1249981 RepID=UPI00119BDAD4|nr:rhodanese-like domain-containing protein [Gillisia sp. Hel_I_86]TVZ28657.1 rhodanese-related sulfurtransferase [Gillisia sp. Hel_I_86]